MSTSLVRLANGVLAVGLLAGCTTPVVTESAPSVGPRPVVTTVARTPSSYKVLLPPKDDGLLKNRLYGAGKVAGVKCVLPTDRQTSERAMVRYATAFIVCLNKGWEPVVKRAGYDFSPPRAVYAAPTGPTSSQCGEMEKDTGAFYCGAENGIYFNWPGYAVEGFGPSVQFLMAHEYGHHLQSLTGMADGYGERYDATVGAAAQELVTERNEMQAHCFAAAFLGANQNSVHMSRVHRSNYGHIGTGSSRASGNFRQWLKRGFTGKGPAGCNTWTAPAAQIK
ncbi:neutral zinc metallopeptidase [Kribbella sp. NPDC051587]|uniref:neutral zinc metallopeptidase n=1 Tax=Kribbella sp. NPDC051587 TaxID=3364119 RepID=UPI0037988634